MLLLHYNTLLSSTLLHDHSILVTNYIQLVLIILVNTFFFAFQGHCHNVDGVHFAYCVSQTLDSHTCCISISIDFLFLYLNYIYLAFACGEGNGTPLQYSCLENPMDGGAWKAAVHGVAEGWTRLSDFSFTFHFHALEKEWQPTPVFLPGESQGPGSLVGCRLWGRTESDTTEVTQQQQQQQLSLEKLKTLYVC